MHSLKNTVLAVGLLGLSFVFYNYSTKPNPNTGDDQLPSELEIKDDVEGIQQSATTNQLVLGSGSQASPASSNKNSFSDSFEIPQLKPSDASTKPIVTSPPTGLQNDLALKSPQAPRQATLDLTANQNLTANDGNFADRSIPVSKSSPSSSNQFQPGNAIQRDTGLIAALETQNTPATAPIHNDNSFGMAGGIEDSSNKVVTANIPDNSFNAKASSSLDIRRPDRAPSQTIDLSSVPFDRVWTTVDELVAESRFRDALELLSRFYRDGSVTGPQRKRLQDWLDALAGKVIFSTEHHLVERPYSVGPNQSLADMAAMWNVPAQVIFNVNRQAISNPANLMAGTKLKQLPGPFDAEVDLNNNTLTLFLDNLYAGKFPVRIGISGNPRPGTYDVMVKAAEGHSWRDANGISFPPGSPENGYGPHWIGLSNSLCIHAIEEATTDGHHGCIGLKASDARDVFAILGKGSTLKIVK